MNLINFCELGTIIDNITQKVACPKCQAHFTTENLGIVASKPDKCVVAGHCEHCDSPMVVTVNVSRADQSMEGEIHMPTRSMSDIAECSEDNESYEQAKNKNHLAQEVAQMSQFLDTCDGDFNTLFSGDQA